MNNLSDQERIDLFKKGDKNAFVELYQKDFKGIHSYTLDLCSNDELARRITRDTFIHIWDLRAGIVSYNHLNACLYIIARQLHLQHLTGRCKPFDDIEHLAYEPGQREAFNKDLEYCCNDAIGKLDQAMKKLSESRKQVLNLLFVEGLRPAVVAGRMKISSQTVLNTKTKALDILHGKIYDRDLLKPVALTALLLYIEQG